MRKFAATLTIASALVVLTAGSAASASTYSDAVQALNPLGYWQLNETTASPAKPAAAANVGSLGAAADGTYGGASFPGQTGALAGDANTSCLFAGGDGMVNVPYSDAYATNTQFTIEFWFKAASTDPSIQALVGCLNPASPRAGWLIYLDGSSPGTINFRTYAGNGTATSLNYNIPVPGGHVVAGTWYHVVVTFDGTTAIGYVNGTAATPSSAASGYLPSPYPDGLAIGARFDVSFQFTGYMDEVSFYSNVLSAGDILAKYQAGTNPAPATSYSQLVLNDNPLLYYRLGEAYTPTTALNSGTLGSAADGLYDTGSMPGQPGPIDHNGQPLAGFGANNYACLFQSSLADSDVSIVGMANQLVGDSPSFPVTVTAWVLASGTSFQTAFGKGDGAYRMNLEPGGQNAFASSGNQSGDVVGNRIVNDGHWHFWAGKWDGTNQYVYVDGMLVGQNATATGNTNGYALAIGTAPDYSGRHFDGTICHVAVFGSVLSDAQIQGLYNAADWPPTIVSEPPNTVASVGQSVSMSVGALGTPTLSYQWYVGPPGGGTPISGSRFTGTNTSTLTINPVQAGDANTYYVVVSNPYGSATSGLFGNSGVLNVVTPLPGSYFQAVIDLNPLAYWPLNETTAPILSQAVNIGTLGTAYNASYAGSGVTYNQPGATSDGDTSIATDGNTGALALPYSSPLALGASGGSFTVEAWINADASMFVNTPWGVMGCAQMNGASSGWQVYTEPNAFEIVMFNHDGGNAAADLTGPPDIQAGQWYHLAIVWDGTAQSVTMYTNGVLYAQQTGVTGFYPNDSGPFVVGDRSDFAAGWYFMGGEDEVAIYTNALSPATLLQHYQTGINPPGTPTYRDLVLTSNPILYYRLDENITPTPITSQPVAQNYGSLGTNDNGYYLPGCFPGAGTGPNVGGFPTTNPVACSFNAQTAPAGFVVPAGWVEVPQDPYNSLDLQAPFTVSAWIQATQTGGGFQSIFGRGDSSYRASVDGGSGGAVHWATPVGEPVGSGVQDGKWHFFVGTYDGSSMNIYLDGVLNKSEAHSGSWSAVNQPFDIGTVPDYTVYRVFDGNMSQVAVFGTALTAAQVDSLYSAAEIAPRILTQPTSKIIPINTAGSVSVTANGTPTLAYQWYKDTLPLANSGNISGADTATLTISPAQLADAGSYHVVITNAYGAVTSTVATVTIASSPIISPDLPAINVAYIGTPAILTVGLTGSGPFSNVWTFNGQPLVDGGRISGAHTTTLTIADAQTSDAGDYQFWSTNSLGTGHSSVGQLIVGYMLGISSTNNPDALGWTGNGNGTYTPSAVNGVLTMTTANNSEVTSFFFNSPLYIGAFIARFTYQDVTINGADGITFCLQNDSRGVNALGGGGNLLGYSGDPGTGIAPSAAIGMELFGQVGSVGWQFLTNGETAASFNPPTPVNLASGDPIDWTISYDGNSVTLTMLDETTAGTYTTNFVVGQLPATVGGDTALVGFTGATGGYNALQTISNFSFLSLTPVLSITPDGSGGVFITWPAISSYMLQVNPSLTNPAGWTTVAGPYPVVSGPLYEEYQVHVTPASGTAFYRLMVTQ